MDWTRYAIYWLPDGPLGRAGADWLGWDARAGQACATGREDTEEPRRYGFHATLKPPFRLVQGTNAEALGVVARALAARTMPEDLGRLSVARLGRFCALVPDRNPSEVAAAMVAGLDAFRAPPDAAELARRRSGGLTPGQDRLLARWGYPYVMDGFRMHLTLTGPHPSDGAEAEAAAHFANGLGPHRIEVVSLVGEDAQGRFHLVEDLPLRGHAADPTDSAATASRTA